MTEFELVKYKYGTVKKYTAFCLTPKLKEPKHSVVMLAGKKISLTATSEGLSSPSARHFQRVLTAKAYLRSIGQDASKFDWSLLENTVAYPTN